MGLLSVSDAVARLVSSLTPVEVIRLPLREAHHRVLSEDITSPTNYPRFDNSSMDGFAVKFEDVRKASPDRPVTLIIDEDIPAGKQPQVTLKTGRAARIMTGAPLPFGADTVIPVEDTDHYNLGEAGDTPVTVKIFKKASPGDNIRPLGQDITSGQLVLHKGRRLRAPDIALLAMLGITEVPVYEKPRVAIITNGDELQSPGEPILPGKIYDSNSVLLTSLSESAGGEIVLVSTAQDSYQSVVQELDRAVESNVHLIISSAGVSVGAYDYMRQVIESSGTLNFWRVDIRPGKPLAFGSYKNVPIIGLPGNPVSSYVGFQVFLNPAFEKLSGEEGLPPIRIRARLSETIESDGRETYFRAILSKEGKELAVSLTGHQGSGNLLSLVQANALLIVPSGVKSLPAGTYADVWLLKD